MKNFLKKNWILIVILVFAAILRLWELGSVPPGLTQDEAALGYNAYSILKTGRDEYGKLLPIIFKSFGDYKPGLYVYLDIPFVATMGLNEVSTRLPSALAGILSIFLIYLIGSRLFSKKLGIFAALVAATNPWLIYYSRGAWEANVVLTFILVGIYFFLKAIRNSKFLFLSSLFFGLTLLTYQGSKISSAIAILLLVVVYWRELIKMGKKYLIGSFVLGLVIAAPIILSFFTGQSGRLKVFSIFSYPRPVEYTQALLNEGGEKVDTGIYYLFHSETLNFIREIFYRWFNYFSGRFLFFDGDYQNPQHSPPYQGMFLVTDFVFLLSGFAVLFKKGFGKTGMFLFLWLILSPLPGVLSRDQVNAIRSMNMVVPILFIIALGFDRLFDWMKSYGRGAIGITAWCAFLIFYFSGFTYFLDSFYIHVSKHNSAYWNYGYKQVVNEVTSIQSQYKDIFVEQSFAQPYIYFLYFQKYSPAKYQSQAVLTNSDNHNDVGLVWKLDNIQFVSVDVSWSALKDQHGALVVVNGVTPIPADLKYMQVDKIYFLNGRDLAFSIIKII